MIKIVAQIVVKEECIDEFHGIAAELVEKSQAEEGNVSYSLNQSINDKCKHAFIELWKDQEAIEKHNASEHFTSLLPKLGELAAEPMSVELYTEV